MLRRSDPLVSIARSAKRQLSFRRDWMLTRWRGKAHGFSAQDLARARRYHRIRCGLDKPALRARAATPLGLFSRPDGKAGA